MIGGVAGQLFVYLRICCFRPPETLHSVYQVVLADRVNVDDGNESNHPNCCHDETSVFESLRLALIFFVGLVAEDEENDGQDKSCHAGDLAVWHHPHVAGFFF